MGCVTLSNSVVTYAPTKCSLCCCVREPNGIKQMNVSGFLSGPEQMATNIVVIPSLVNTCVCTVHNGPGKYYDTYLFLLLRLHALPHSILNQTTDAVFNLSIFISKQSQS